MIGVQVRYCSNELEERSRCTLLGLGDFRLSWLVDHAYWVNAMSGKDTVPILSEILRRHRLIEITRQPLLSLRPIDTSWVDRVISLTS